LKEVEKAVVGTLSALRREHAENIASLDEAIQKNQSKGEERMPEASGDWTRRLEENTLREEGALRKDSSQELYKARGR
jgi:hypothetical protein